MKKTLYESRRRNFIVLKHKLHLKNLIQLKEVSYSSGTGSENGDFQESRGGLLFPLSCILKGPFCLSEGPIQSLKKKAYLASRKLATYPVRHWFLELNFVQFYHYYQNYANELSKKICKKIIFISNFKNQSKKSSSLYFTLTFKNFSSTSI